MNILTLDDGGERAYMTNGVCNGLASIWWTAVRPEDAGLNMSHLGNCRHGKLLEQPQTRAGAPVPDRHRAEARAAIFEWIDFFNRERFYNTLGLEFPVDFETQLN